jgi:hypothetical protein
MDSCHRRCRRSDDDIEKLSDEELDVLQARYEKIRGMHRAKQA